MYRICFFLLAFVVSAVMAESTVAEAANRDAKGLKEFKTPRGPIPDYLSYYTDEAFFSRVYRITDNPGTRVRSTSSTWSNDARHRYSKISPWNCNGSLILLTNKGKRNDKVFLDAQTFRPRFERRSPGSEFRWLPNNSHEMLYTTGNSLGIWNVLTDSRRIIHKFAGVQKIYIGPYEGNLSHNGKRVALMGEYGSRKSLILFNINKRKELLRKALPSNIDLDWLSVSPKGNLIVMNGNFGGGDQTKVYDAKTYRLLQHWKAYGTPSHYDLSVDTTGTEVAIGVAKSGKYEGRVIKRNLRTGKITPLTPKGYASHTSARNINRPGWAYVTYQGKTKWAPFADEVIAVKTDGSQKFVRIAKLHSKRTDYRSEAHAVPSPDGRHVLWASNWKASSGRPLGAFVSQVNGIGNNSPRAECLKR